MNNILNTKTIFTIIYFYFCWSLGINAAQFYTGGGLLNLVGIPDAFLTAFYSAYQPSFWLPHAYSELEIKFGLSALLPAIILYLELVKPKKNYRKGEEYGSAKFGKTTDIKEIMDKEFQNNIFDQVFFDAGFRSDIMDLPAFLKESRNNGKMRGNMSGSTAAG